MSGLGRLNPVNLLKSVVPGGEVLAPLVEEGAKSLLLNDVSSGFTCQKIVNIGPLAGNLGIQGYSMTSIPDGSETFVSENKHCGHCCCCWFCGGPTYTFWLGNPLSHDTKETLKMQTHKAFCCVNPTLEVTTPDAKTVALAEEHAYCPCSSVTTITTSHMMNMGEMAPTYQVQSRWFDLFFCCCTVFTSRQHQIFTAPVPEKPLGPSLGTITFSGDHFEIKFPQDARTSDKAGVIAAAFLFRMRHRIFC